MRRRARLLLAALPLAGLLAIPAADAASRRDSGPVFEFGTMTPVTEPLTGAAQPVRGISGGGLPWELRSAKAELNHRGHLEVRVHGLTLARRAPVPPAQQGTNPIPAFKAVVSCLTVSGGTVRTVNVSTDTAPATTTGDSRIEDSVALPSPCIAPIVFVTSPTTAWFATTGG